jgi:hypothetical protein
MMSSKKGMRGVIHRERIGGGPHYIALAFKWLRKGVNMDDPESDPNFRNLENICFAKNSDDG